MVGERLCGRKAHCVRQWSLETDDGWVGDGWYGM